MAGCCAAFRCPDAAQATAGGTLTQLTPSGTSTTLAARCNDQLYANGGPSGGFFQASNGDLYGIVSNYLGDFLTDVSTGGNSLVAYYFANDTPSPRVLFEGANTVFYGTDGTSVFALDHVIAQ
jgi:hypothetical protein